MKTMLVHSKVAAEVPVGVFAVTLSVSHNPGCQEKNNQEFGFFFIDFFFTFLWSVGFC